MNRYTRGSAEDNTSTRDQALRTDGGTDNNADAGSQSPEAPPSHRVRSRENMSRGEKFHQSTGDFKDVGKALAILVVLGIIAYFIFVF